MCIYIYIYTYVCVYIYIYIHIFLMLYHVIVQYISLMPVFDKQTTNTLLRGRPAGSLYTYWGVYIYIYIYTHMYNISLSIHICIYIYIYSMYVCVYIYIYIHTYVLEGYQGMRRRRRVTWRGA